MRTQTEGSVITAVVKREFQTHKIITLSFVQDSLVRNYGKSHEERNFNISTCAKSRENDLLAKFI